MLFSFVNSPPTFSLYSLNKYIRVFVGFVISMFVPLTMAFAWGKKCWWETCCFFEKLPPRYQRAHTKTWIDQIQNRQTQRVCLIRSNIYIYIDRWIKGCILPFSKKGDLGIAKNYRGITLISIAAKIYNAPQRNHVEPKFKKILRKNQNGFWKNRFTTSQILTIRQILEGVRSKNLPVTILFVDFSKAFDSVHRRMM